MAFLSAVRERLGLVPHKSPQTARHASRAQGAAPGFTRSVYGPWLKTVPDDLTFRFCVEGYGDFVADCIRNRDAAFLFLDIGANIGVFSLLADTVPSCRAAYAFEPVPATFANLEANIAYNAASKVAPINAAIAESRKGKVWLSYDPAHSGLSAVTGRRRGAVEAPALGAPDLAALVTEWPETIVAKIDVEGDEANVISILARTPFYGALNDIIVEVSSRNTNATTRDRLLHVLATEGFEMRSRAGEDDHYDAHFQRPPSKRPRRQ
jgi:FkbM family methyltransferase